METSPVCPFKPNTDSTSASIASGGCLTVSWFICKTIHVLCVSGAQWVGDVRDFHTYLRLESVPMLFARDTRLSVSYAQHADTVREVKKLARPLRRELYGLH